MKKITFLLLLLSHIGFAQQKAKTAGGKYHLVCIQSSDVYHDMPGCSTLQMCSGGKIRKTKNVDHLKPCRKCARPRYTHRAAGFSDIKRVLGVKDKRQIADSLGTSEGTIQRPGGLFIRIMGPPDSRTVNTLEFYFNSPVTFHEDSLLSTQFYERLGLQFGGCKADTIRNQTPHPVTGKVKKDFTIEYRHCAVVERRDNYEDVGKYYYELTFLARDSEISAELEKIQLVLKADKP